MAEFIHRREELLQKPTRAVCHVCGASWPMPATPQADLERHVLYHHPLEWEEFRGYRKDVAELERMYRL